MASPPPEDADADQDAVMADAPPPAPPPTPPPPVDLDLHEALASVRAQNGARNGDYQRYRTYCARRVRRVAKSIGLSHGKGKAFVKHETGPEADVLLPTEEHVMLLGLQAERAWAHAMELKQDATRSAGTPHRRAKNHVVRKFAKAASWGAQLEATCAERCLPRTRLEAMAYAGWLEGCLQMEKEHWRPALAALGRARTVCAKLGAAGSGGAQAVFALRTEEIVQAIRFCRYGLGGTTRGGGGGGGAQAAPEGAAVDDALAALLDELGLGGDVDGAAGPDGDDMDGVGEAPQRRASGSGEVQWRQHVLVLSSAPLRAAVAEASAAAAALDAALTAAAAPAEEVDGLYAAAFAAYDAAAAVAEKEGAQFAAMAASGGDGSKAEAQRAEVALVADYVAYLKFSCMLDRNLRLAADLRRAWDVQLHATCAAAARHGSGGGAAAPLKADAHGKCEDIVRVYDAVLQIDQQISDLKGVEADADLADEQAALALAHRALKAYYLGDSYCHKREWAKAVAMHDHAAYLGAQAAEQLMLCAEEDVAAALDQANALADMASGARSRTKALAFLHATAGAAAAAPPAAAAAQGPPQATLLARRDEYDAGGESYALAEIPAKFAAAPCRPMFFDIARQDLAYPDGLDEKAAAANAHAGWGVARALGGFFRGRS